MKQITFLFLLALPIMAYSQHNYPIKLSSTLNETRMGLWAKGDYKVYVELGLVERSLPNAGNSFITGANNKASADSIPQHTAIRFRKAAGQLKKAGNGFDLRKLVLYDGPDNEKGNKGSSLIVEDVVRRLVQSGLASVYYKGKRIYKVTRHDEPQGTGVDFGYNTLIYFEDAANYIFKYYEHLGW